MRRVWIHTIILGFVVVEFDLFVNSLETRCTMGSQGMVISTNAAQHELEICSGNTPKRIQVVSAADNSKLDEIPVPCEVNGRLYLPGQIVKYNQDHLVCCAFGKKLKTIYLERDSIPKEGLSSVEDGYWLIAPFN